MLDYKERYAGSQVLLPALSEGAAAVASSPSPDDQQQLWRFCHEDVFGQTLDGFSLQLLELRQVFEAAVQFQQLEKLEVGGLRGKILTERVREVSTELGCKFNVRFFYPRFSASLKCSLSSGATWTSISPPRWPANGNAFDGSKPCSSAECSCWSRSWPQFCCRPLNNVTAGCTCSGWLWCLAPCCNAKLWDRNWPESCRISSLSTTLKWSSWRIVWGRSCWATKYVAWPLYLWPTTFHRLRMPWCGWSSI